MENYSKPQFSFLDIFEKGLSTSRHENLPCNLLESYCIFILNPNPYHVFLQLNEF